MWHTQPTVLAKPQLSSPRNTRPGVLSLGCHATRIASSVESSMFIASVSYSLNAYDLPHWIGAWRRKEGSSELRPEYNRARYGPIFPRRAREGSYNIYTHLESFGKMLLLIFERKSALAVFGPYACPNSFHASLTVSILLQLLQKRIAQEGQSRYQYSPLLKLWGGLKQSSSKYGSGLLLRWRQWSRDCKHTLLVQQLYQHL